MAENAGIKNRSEIEDKYKWRLCDIYPNTDGWEADFKELSDCAQEIAAMKDTIAQDADSLARGLNRLDEISHMLEKLYVYARMGRDMDNADAHYQALTDRISTLAVKISAA